MLVVSLHVKIQLCKTPIWSDLNDHPRCFVREPSCRFAHQLRHVSRLIRPCHEREAGRLLRPRGRRRVLTFPLLQSIASTAFALPSPEMAVPRCRPRKFCATVRTDSFHCAATFLALVAEEIAESGELPSIAAVVEALGFRP